MKSLVLDTHTFLWLLEGNPKLPGSLRVLIEDPSTDLYLPALVVAELVDLICKGRSKLDLSDLDVAIKSDSRLIVLPMTDVIAMATGRFASLPDIHDRCIVATTAILLEAVPEVVLATRDRSILNPGMVPTTWE